LHQLYDGAEGNPHSILCCGAVYTEGRGGASEVKGEIQRAYGDPQDIPDRKEGVSVQDGC